MEERGSSLIVVDASLVGPLTIPDEQPSLDDAAASTLTGTMLLVPQHWRLEVASVLSTAVRRSRMTPSQRDEALLLLTALPVTVDAETGAMAWSATLALADRHRLTPYDAAYLELAARVGASLATRDRALIAAARAEHVETLDFLL